MKRVLLMLAATAAFACTTAVAQTSAGTDTSAQTGTQTTKMSHHHKGGAMDNGGKSGKMSTLTGCLSASPDSSGMYTLSNGRYKSGVEVGPTDKVKDHAGHQVALKGHWGAAGAAGENGGVASSTNSSSKSFDVDSVKHISDTCKEAPGGGTAGHKKGKKGSDTGASTTPQGF